MSRPTSSMSGVRKHLLRGRRQRRGRRLEPEEERHLRLHSRAREERRVVVGARDQRRGRAAQMALLLEEREEALAQLGRRPHGGIVRSGDSCRPRPGARQGVYGARPAGPARGRARRRGRLRPGSRLRLVLGWGSRRASVDGGVGPAPAGPRRGPASRRCAASFAASMASRTPRLAERREAVRDARREAGDLLDRLGDRHRDRADRGVGAVGHRDGAVGDRVEPCRAGC